MVVGLVLQVGDAKKFSHALGFDSLDPFFKVSKQGQCFTAVEEDGGDKRLVELNLHSKSGGKTRDQKVASSNSSHSSGEIFFSRVNFLC